LPDGDAADQKYVINRDALVRTKKVAIGQRIVHDRDHLGAIKL
jgi:non-homologous end joining protein Ku